MKHTLTALAITAIFSFTACSEEKPETTTANMAPFGAQATPQADAKSGEALNPAHGQPNHRCDIAVGAPLNSPKQPNLVVPQTKNIGQGTSSGPNPPHGQPGHDCSRPVTTQ